jgi:hypothetical protein
MLGTSAWSRKQVNKWVKAEEGWAEVIVSEVTINSPKVKSGTDCVQNMPSTALQNLVPSETQKSFFNSYLHHTPC